MKQLTLSFLLLLQPLLASAFTGEAIIDGINYYIITKGKTAEVRSLPNLERYTGNISIPSTIEYDGVLCSVTSIGEYAFQYSGVTSVTIPNSVTSIGLRAFANCSDLKSLTIPNSVTFIEYGAFEYCRSLTSIAIPNNLTSISSYVFQKCTGLISINIPNSVTMIYDAAFQGCSGLASVNIPNSVTSIGGSAFKGCSGLTSITIGGGVKKLNALAFSNCPELTDVTCLSELLTTSDGGGEALFTSISAFDGSYVEYATLHVPESAINTYKNIFPWRLFGKFMAIEGGDTPEIKKCATPTISIENGKVKFSCETEGVEFVSSVSAPDANNYNGSELSLSYKYNVSVYAIKEGYENSETATAEITATGAFGDLTGDGKVDVADHVKLSEIIMNK